MSRNSPGYDKRYYEAHHEQRNKQTAELKAKRIAADPERERTVRQAYLMRNREKINARSRERFATDPAFRAAQYDRGARRRAAKRGATAEKVDRLEIIKRDKQRCHLCGKRVPKEQIHLDHLIPLSLGGAHTAANVAVAHASCNRRKRTRALNEQLRLLG